jgi:hypothetical protein
MASKLFSLVSVLALVAITSCSVLKPEAGLPVPKDPGTAIIRVGDQLGAPVPRVGITVSEIPNSVGGFFGESQASDANGTATFTDIPAGSRRVEMTVPPGFAPDADGAVRQVAVVKSASVTVAFRIIRE